MRITGKTRMPKQLFGEDESEGRDRMVNAGEMIVRLTVTNKAGETRFASVDDFGSLASLADALGKTWVDVHDGATIEPISLASAGGEMAIVVEKPSGSPESVLIEF